MKKIITLNMICFIICTSFNNPTTTTDYRNAYTGTYFCNRMCDSYSGHKPGENSKSDTISIIITKDAVDSVLQISIEQQIFKIKLFNKTLQAYPINGHYGGYFFASESIEFYFANGRAHSCKIMGKRK